MNMKTSILTHECRRCGANECFYFYKGKCRRCIGLKVAKEPASKFVHIDTMNIGFELTKDQKRVSKALLDFVEQGKNVYLEAVCGAGKTEMCYELIKRSINTGLKIGWAIPRREVVLELYSRLSGVYPNIKVVRVCEGYTDELFGELIICTTHQLFRYFEYFDILIIDEPDAFPFYGNDMLQFMARRASRHNLVYLSATFDCDEDFEVLSLSSRPSGRPLPLPKVVGLFKTLEKLIEWRTEAVLIFVPKRKLALIVSIILNCPMITSVSEKKEEILKQFRKNKGRLVCTTILERGVTFQDCFVIVLFANHQVFNKASLVQIAGRVERGMNPKKGEVIFCGNGLEVKACLKYIHHHRNIVLHAS